jgi:hypothetical protein
MVGPCQSGACDAQPMIQSETNKAALSSYDKLKTNPDGSSDLFFGQKAPQGNETNWVKTVAVKDGSPTSARKYQGRSHITIRATFNVPNALLNSYSKQEGEREPMKKHRAAKRPERNIWEAQGRVTTMRIVWTMSILNLQN